jgi:glucose-6-phosphate dehydrogenase assembly protein OpcA
VEEAVSSIPPASTLLARLDKELRDMWDGPPESTAAPRTRVCTTNLVVVASGRDVANRYVSVVDEVRQSMPARAIIVTLEPEGLDQLDGDATAVCSVADSGSMVCSERVRLFASGGACARISSSVETLLVPEIPTSLVWLGRVHPGDPVFRALALDAQRVVLDTEYTSLTSLMHLARWAREDAARPHIADLAWTRLGAWQEMCARFFDAPRLRQFAQKVTKVSIVQASERGARLGSEGALLLGWLATRLGWKASRLGGALRLVRPDGGTVGLGLGSVDRPPVVAPAALAKVTIEAEVSGKKLVGTVARALGSGSTPDNGGKTTDADVVVWTLSESGESPIEQSLRLSTNQAASVLERTLRRPAFDPALAESVAFAEPIFEDGIPC